MSQSNDQSTNIVVSVLIPVFDTEKYLRESLDSMRNQTLKEIEVICVDDGSTDSSPQILAEFAAADPRFRIFHQKNLGPSDARNWAVRESRGKYLYFMDSDDILELDALRQAVEFAEQNALDLVCFDAEPFAENNECPDELENFRKSYFRKFDYPGICTGAQMMMRMQNHNDMVVAPWASMLRRELFVPNAMWYYPRIAHADVSYSFLAYLSARRAGYMKKIFFHRRVRPGSIMTGSKLSHHSWSYFCGCKLMTKRLEGFQLPAQEKAAAVKYIQVRLNMAQRYYTQMNDRERADCIASTGADAPLYRQMVALPAEARQQRRRQHERYQRLSRALRETNRLIREQESHYRSVKGHGKQGDIYEKYVASHVNDAAYRIPTWQAVPEESSGDFPTMYQTFRQAVDTLSAMPTVPSGTEEYICPVNQTAALLDKAAGQFRRLSREEREQLLQLSVGDRDLMAMLLTIRCENEATAGAEGRAANECERLLEKRMAYLRQLVSFRTGVLKKHYERTVKQLVEEGTATSSESAQRLSSLQRSTSKRWNSLQRSTSKRWNSLRKANRKHWNNLRYNLKTKYRPVRVAMLGYYQLRGAGANAEKRELLDALKTWNVSEEYGAGVMVRYQEILDGPRSDLDDNRKKRTFAFRTTSMSYGADEYDYLAKGLYGMPRASQAAVPTHVRLALLAEKWNTPAAMLRLSKQYAAVRSGAQYGNVLSGYTEKHTDSLRVCTLRQDGAITVPFAALRLQKGRKAELWTAPVDPRTGRLGQPAGSLGGTEEAPDLSSCTLPCWEGAVSLCEEAHRNAPCGAELVVWEVRLVNDAPVITSAGEDLAFVDRDADGNSLLPTVVRLTAQAVPNRIILSAPSRSGDTLSCDYRAEGSWSAIFPEEKRLSIRCEAEAPDAIQIIPFMAMVLPAAWIYRAEVVVPACDKAWLDCLPQLAVAAQELYPELPTANLVRAERKEACQQVADAIAVLCLDAADAAYSAYSHKAENPTLLAVDAAGQEAAEELPFPTLSAELLRGLDLPEADRLDPDGTWRERFALPFARLGAAVPSAWQARAKKLCMTLADPAFDSYIRFGACTCEHDGFGITREEKLMLAADMSADNAGE